jgi:hypothetical protein
MHKPFSSIFPNPHRASEALEEERVRRAIDSLLDYRRWEILLALGIVWGLFLLMIFTLLVTIRTAFYIF